MRNITTHHTNECNKALLIDAEDRNENGVTKLYVIRVTDVPGRTVGVPRVVALPFQYGPIAEVGVNGLTLESLYAIILDQLEGYQSSKFANEFNETALNFTRGALVALEARTKQRTERGVEGTHAV